MLTNATNIINWQQFDKFQYKTESFCYKLINTIESTY